MNQITAALTAAARGAWRGEGRRRPVGMLRSAAVVPGGCGVVATICYGAGGEGMDGDRRCEEESGAVV